MCPTIVPYTYEAKKEKRIYFTSLLKDMKVLVATEKPFAKKAVEGIRGIVEEAGYELALLEKYADRAELLSAVADVDAMDRFGDILMGRMAGLLSVLKYAGLLMAALLLRGTVPAGNRRLGRLSGWLLAVACCLVVFWGASNAFPGMSSLVGWGLVALVVRCLALLSSVAEVVVLLLFGLELARLGGRRFKDCGMLLCVLPLLAELSTAAWYAGPAFSPVLFGGVYLLSLIHI